MLKETQAREPANVIRNYVVMKRSLLVLSLYGGLDISASKLLFCMVVPFAFFGGEFFLCRLHGMHECP